MLRLLYLTIDETLSEDSGVSRKLNLKIRALGDHSSSCNYINAIPSVEHNRVMQYDLKGGGVELEIGVASANTGYINQIRSDRQFFKVLSQFILSNYTVDRIIMRYPQASLGLRDFVRIFRGRVVFEHNTFEIEEFKHVLSRRNVSFSLRPSRFFYWFQEMKWPILAERFVAPDIFAAAHSGACVTSEIAEYEKRRYRRYRTFLSSNFYQVSEVIPEVITWHPGQLLKFGFIVSNFSPWYGIERLLESFSRAQEYCELRIAGVDSTDDRLQLLVKRFGIKKNLYCLGKISGEDLKHFYSSIHISFGSLALYKTKLRFASTLKVKESIAYGRPVAIAYYEQDFYGNAKFDGFYLQLPNDASLIDFQKLSEFARQFYRDPQNQLRLHQLALETIDVGVKVKKFVSEITH